jgi:hypothetical protein
VSSTVGTGGSEDDVYSRCDATPQDYGRLLALGVSPLGAGFAASSTSRSFSSLKRRIGMLNHTTPSARTRYSGWLLAAAAAVAIVPMQVVARTAPATTSRTPTPVEQDFSPAQQNQSSGRKVAQDVSALIADAVQVETRTSGSHPSSCSSSARTTR